MKVDLFLIWKIRKNLVKNELNEYLNKYFEETQKIKIE